MGEAPLPFGPYLLVERLAGARATFRAVRRDGEGGGELDGRAVALKRMAAGAGAAGSVPVLCHMNLAAVLERGVVGGERFVTSELVEARSLERVLRAGPLPAIAAAFVVAEAARGIAFLHGRAVDGIGLVHGRLAPRTVLLAADGGVKVCGLERSIAPPARLGSGHAGEEDRGFRAPEQVAGEPLDGRADVFSLGALLLAALGGEAAGEAPAALIAIAARTSARSRASRPASAALIERELREWLAAQPIAFGRAELAELLAARAPDDPASGESIDDGEPATREPAPRARPGWLDTLRAAVIPDAVIAVERERSQPRALSPAAIPAAAAAHLPAPAHGVTHRRRGLLLAAFALVLLASAFAVLASGVTLHAAPPTPEIRP